MILISSLAACTQSANSVHGCGSEDAKKLTKEIVLENIELQLSNIVDKEFKDIKQHISISDMQANIKQIQLAVEDIRTTEKSNNTSKRECAATLHFTIPNNILNEANETIKILEQDTDVSKLLAVGYKKEGDNYTTEIKYNVQLTDDKKKIFVKLENGNQVTTPISQVITLGMLKNPIQQFKNILNHFNKQGSVISNMEKLANQIEMQDTNTNNEEVIGDEAIEEDNDITHEIEALTEQQKLSLKEINQYWEGLPKSLQDKWLNEQTAWNKKMKQECEAVGRSNEQVKFMLNCKIEKMEARLNELSSRKQAWEIEQKTQAEKVKQSEENQPNVTKPAEQEQPQDNEIKRQHLKVVSDINQTLRKIPADISEPIHADYQKWLNELETRCQNDIACEVHELENKLNELKGYVI